MEKFLLIMMLHSVGFERNGNCNYGNTINECQQLQVAARFD